MASFNKSCQKVSAHQDTMVLASLAPAVVLTICACFAYVLRASDERTEPKAESKAEAVDSKRAYDWLGTLSQVTGQYCAFSRYLKNNFVFKD